MFSGELADSAEHIMPKWLQRRFNLWDQTLVLPNGTTSPYRQVKIPVRSEHNSRFSKIEEKMASGAFSEEEAYLWAMKIHVGLIYRNSRLKIRRHVPTEATILDITDYGTEVWLFRMLYDIWRAGGATEPSPFGSVYIVESLLQPQEFDFFHCMLTGTVGINVGDKFILVFFWDQGDAKQSNLQDHWDQYHKQRTSLYADSERPQAAYLAHHVWACEGAYSVYRRRRSFSLMRAHDKMALVPPMFRARPKPFDRKEYEIICRNFGLRILEFRGELGNVYGSIFAGDSV